MRRFSRRIAVALLSAGLCAAALPAGAAPQSTANPPIEMVMGNPKAKVTVIEWGSVTCPHCAAFNAEVFPAFKKKYVDTGQVRFVFREFLTAPAAISAAGFLIARCAGPAKYFAVTDDVFKSQPELFASADANGNLDTQKVLAVLKRIGGTAGLSEDQVMACITDPAATAALQQRVDNAVQLDKINSTPTFQVGATKVSGVQSLAQLDALIQPLLKK